jgi:protein SCO1/2
MIRILLHTFAAMALLLVSTSAAWSQAPQHSRELAAVNVVERLGETVPLDLAFVDHDGRSVTLADYFDGQRPVVLTLNYYNCPMLCGLHLNAFTTGLREFDWVAGQNYRIVTISIAPDEGPELAAAKRVSHLVSLGRGDDVDWSFLTGTEESIRAIAEATGYGYTWVEATGEYAHPAVVTFLSPSGTITRYLYGLVYSPQDLRLAILEASEGRVGTAIDRFLLACYMYDPEAGSYVRDAFTLMRLGGALTVVALGLMLALLWRWDRARTAAGVTQG